MAAPFSEQFFDRFALPLLRGGEVAIGRPLGGRGMRRLLTELASASGGGEHLSGLVSAAQDRLLSMGIPPPSDPRHFDDPGALLLLAALHDLLFLARPEVGGLRPALRAALLHEIETSLQPLVPEPSELSEPDDPLAPDRPSAIAESEQAAAAAQRDAQILMRHALAEPLFRLQRLDRRRRTWLGEQLDRGVPGRAGATEPSGEDGLELTSLCWPELLLVVGGQGTQVLRALLAASPLTALWYPRPPSAVAGQGLALDLRQLAPLLRRRHLSRIVCRRYLALGLSAVAQVLSGPLVALLGQAASDAGARRDLQTWLGLCSHLHWLSYVVFPSSSGLTAAIPESETPFFALFASLWLSAPQLARPADLTVDSPLYQRAVAHAEACRAAVPPIVVSHLQGLLTRALGSPSQ